MTAEMANQRQAQSAINTETTAIQVKDNPQWAYQQSYQRGRKLQELVQECLQYLSEHNHL